MSRRAETLPMVFVERAKCPRCESIDLHTKKSIDQRDGSTMRRTVCRECGEKFLVIIE
jgi:transcriptional regulator NrdR family protein